MAEVSKSWEKRLQGEPDEMAVEFVESLSYDRRLWKYDIAGSMAHATMLNKQGLLSYEEFEQIETGLKKISSELESGKFTFDKRYEDIHMAVEAALIEKIGEAGKKLHTGRSRNDQVATDMRLWMRDEIQSLRSKISGVQAALVDAAERYAGDVMPCYTHLQRAQPVVIGAYLLSFVEQLDRDFARLDNCGTLMNVSPLGSGALAGSTLELDRSITAAQLGFDGVSANSIDSVSDRDFCAEFIFDCSMIMTHLSRLAEDLIIFSTSEFGFVRIDDSFCTSSSMMPQKRNPDMLELIRGKTGSVYGALMAMLTILKAQPSGYNRDIQEDKIHVFAAADTVSMCLEMAGAIVGHAQFDTKIINAGIDEGYLDATALAEYLVSKGVAFREGHGVVGSLVAYCEKKGKKLGDLKLSEFGKYTDSIGEDVYEYLGAKNVVSRYSTAGSAGAVQTAEQIVIWKQRLGER